MQIDQSGHNWLAAVLVAAGLSILAHHLERPAARTAARYGAAIAALGIARAAGASWAELGFGRGELGSGLRTGMMAGGCATAVTLTGAALPATRGYFIDQRAAASVGRGALADGLARITFAAVPPEEVIYRSALLGLRMRPDRRFGGLAWPSLLFGLSHIEPTLATMSQTAAHRHLAGRPLRRAAFVAGNVVVTSLAGAAFGWLRLRSGSVLAPLLAHAALNDSGLLAGRLAHRLSRESGLATPLTGGSNRADEGAG